MTTKELRAYIDRVLGNNVRLLLPSYWWKRLFGMVVDKVEEIDKQGKTKQDILVSGQNIKTINGESILGSGDIVIEGGEGSYDDTEIRQELTELSEETSARFIESAESIRTLEDKAESKFASVDSEIENLKKGEAYIMDDRLVFRNYADAKIEGETLKL